MTPRRAYHLRWALDAFGWSSIGAITASLAWMGAILGLNLAALLFLLGACLTCWLVDVFGHLYINRAVRRARITRPRPADRIGA